MWKITRNGEPKRIAALPVEALPNEIVHHAGYLYAADSALGLIWRVSDAGGTPEIWASGEELAQVGGGLPGLPRAPAPAAKLDAGLARSSGVPATIGLSATRRRGLEIASRGSVGGATVGRQLGSDPLRLVQGGRRVPATVDRARLPPARGTCRLRYARTPALTVAVRLPGVGEIPGAVRVGAAGRL